MAGLHGGSSHNYETINISGSATAILGDQYRTGDSWHIEKITVNVQNNDIVSTDGLLRGIKRRLLTNIEGATQQEPPDTNQPTQDRPTKRAKKTPLAKLWVRQKLSKHSNSSSSDSPEPRESTLRGFLRPLRTGLLPEPTTNISRTLSPSSNETLISTRDTQFELDATGPTLPPALLAGLIARNLSFESVRLFLHRMQHDPLFPLVTAIMSCWLVNLYNSIRGRSLSELSGDCIWFEDVYQIRVKIPQACLADTEMLSAFFKSHYRNTSAEQFVADKQYNLFSGSRDGTPTSIEELCSAEHVENIFMAMLYRASFDSCLNCSNKISPNKFLSEGLQRCDYCRRQYRIYFSQTVAQSFSDTSAFLLPAWRQPNLLANVDGLGGMLNVDLNLQWKSHQNIGRLVKTMPKTTKNWWSNDASFDTSSKTVNASPFGAQTHGTNEHRDFHRENLQPQMTFTSLECGGSHGALWQSAPFEPVKSGLLDKSQRYDDEGQNSQEESQYSDDQSQLHDDDSQHSDDESQNLVDVSQYLIDESLHPDDKSQYWNDERLHHEDEDSMEAAHQKMLMEDCAVPNIYGTQLGLDLQKPSRNGLVSEVQSLLAQGADINARGGDYGNALQAASRGGHKKVVRMLLEQGADVNALGGPYGSALQAASCCDATRLVQTLLDKGAEVNAQGGSFSNALCAASYYGNEQVVQVLLERGADVHAQGKLYGNALHVASLRGHEQVVQTLLSRGAEIDAKADVGTALYLAAKRGHKNVVRILLEKGADTNIQGEHGTALQAARAFRHEKIVRMLLDKDSESRHNEPVSPRLWAFNTSPSGWPTFEETNWTGIKK